MAQGLRQVLAYSEWCVMCRRYQPHSGWASAGSNQPTVGICAGCGANHSS